MPVFASFFFFLEGRWFIILIVDDGLPLYNNSVFVLVQGKLRGFVAGAVFRSAMCTVMHQGPDDGNLPFQVRLQTFYLGRR